MARIRTIKPEFWNNEALSSLPEATHVLAAALLNHADDEGYFNANPALIKAACSALREPTIPIQKSLEALEAIGYLRLIFPQENGGAPLLAKPGRQFGVIVNFTKHQTISRSKPSRIKQFLASLASPCPVMDEATQKSAGTGNREQGMEQGVSCGEDATAHDGSASANGDEDGEQANAEATSQANGQSYPEAFEAFWSAYPTRGGRKRGKGKCFGIWRQSIRATDRKPLVEAAQHFAASDDSTRGYARDPERFLRADWWREWIPAMETPAARPPPAPSKPIPARIAPANFLQ